MPVTNLSAKLAEFRKLSRDRMQTVVEKSVIRAGTSVIVESPVDTGRFAANWMFAFGDYDGTTLNGEFSGEGERQGSISKLTSNVSNIEMGSTFFMTNSLPYADRLENKEWSAKGSKMVARAVMNFPAIAAEEIGKVK